MKYLDKIYQYLAAKWKSIKNSCDAIIMCFKRFYDYWENYYNNTPPAYCGANDENDDSSVDIWETMLPYNPEFNNNNKEQLVETLNDTIDNSIVYYMSAKNICAIRISNKRSVIEELQVVDVTANPHYTLLKCDNQLGAVSSIMIGNTRYSVTCNHVLQLMELCDIKQYMPINPQVVITCRNTKLRQATWVTAAKSDFCWFTKDIIRGKHVYIHSNITKTINVPLLVNKRPKLSTIAVVINVAFTESYLMSGTLIEVDRRPYVVTFVNHNPDKSVTSIVAVAAFVHDIEIQLIHEVQ